MTTERDLQLAATQDYLHSIERLMIVVQELSSAHSLEEITKIALSAVRELTSSDGATFVLSDNGFSYYFDEDAIAPLWKGQRFPMDTTMNGWVIRTHQPVIIEDVFNDHRNYRSFYEHTFIKSMAIVPIFNKERMIVMGTIGTYWGYQHQATTEEVKLLQSLAASTAVAMENIQIYSQLEQQLRERTNALEAVKIRLQQEIQERKDIEAEILRLSLTDELTGLNNRRGFFLLAEQQLRLAKRSKIHITLMFIELNGLEEINETFGNEFGVDAIIAIARLLKRSFRCSDTLGRIREDEFVVLIQENRTACQVIQERVETNIVEFNQNQTLPFLISVNIGIQSYSYSQNLSLEDLITLAHIHIYQKK
ncbi:MAG: diguanylate cyclase [Nostocales cyanobacterium]|nr:MAG: diguanylate cyclase [Nostocales cyanobacterium]